jgi:hypothetical protein
MEALGKFFQSERHHGAVEGSAHVQGAASPPTYVPVFGLKSQQARLGATHDNLTFAVDIGDPNIAALLAIVL